MVVVFVLVMVMQVARTPTTTEAVFAGFQKDGRVHDIGRDCSGWPGVGLTVLPGRWGLDWRA